MKQLKLIPDISKEHGGSLNTRKRKGFKPLSFKKLTHLVLKSNGQSSLNKHRNVILKTIRRQEALAGVKIYGLSVQHDHIHHSVLCSNKAQYNRFIRAVTGILARKLGRGLWKYRPYTKIIEWGRQAQNLKMYIEMNELEVSGQIPYRVRRK